MVNRRRPRVLAAGLLMSVLAAAWGCGGDPSGAVPVSIPVAVPVAWPDERACAVEVTGTKFEWSFRFPGKDGQFGTDDDLLCRHDLHLPRGVPVELKLTSTDYIYTLKLPDLQLEEIAVPELFHTLKLDGRQGGSFPLLSDPMCAVRFSHDEEMGRLLVEDRGAFEAWLVKLAR